MRHINFFLLGFISILFCLLISCEEDGSFVETPPEVQGRNDYFIFGEYYGFCAGECVTLYKLTNNQLVKDEEEVFTGQEEDVTFSSLTLSAEDRAIAQNLLAQLPDSLLLTAGTSTTFGCPDCYDQGTILLSLKNDTTKSSWLVDTDEANLPDFLKDYVANVKQALIDLP